MADQLDFSWLLTRLRHSLQALAMPADVQLSLFPDFVCKADELALDFDHWRLCVVTNDDFKLTDQQQALLATLDEQVAAMSEAEHSPLWTEEALRTRPEWANVRRLATETLVAFAWDVDTPPSYGHEYIPSRRSE